jgi:hypothetical protein
MCDYSLHLVVSRPARVGDKLIRPRRVFPNEVFSFEELNESATSARWTASRRGKSEA